MKYLYIKHYFKTQLGIYWMWEPRDIWVGIYWTYDGKHRNGETLYNFYKVFLCILPCLPIKFQWCKAVKEEE